MFFKPESNISPGKHMGSGRRRTALKIRRPRAILEMPPPNRGSHGHNGRRRNGKMELGKYLKRKYLALCAKVVREEADPESIARGWAIGMFCGCAIPFGFQLIISVPAAILMKGSKIGATVGTLITNHFTILFIYPVQCYVGNKIIGAFTGKGFSWEEVKTAMDVLINDQSFSALMGLGWELAASFFVGGALLAAVMTPLTYYGVRHLVISRQARRKRNQAAGESDAAPERDVMK